MDELLLRRAQQGDEGAFEQMVTPLEPGNASQHCFVAIKRDNFLKLKASIQVHPKVNFDMQVTDGGVF